MMKAIVSGLVPLALLSAACSMSLLHGCASSGDDFDVLRTWDGTISDRKGVKAYERALQKFEEQEYSADDIGRFLAIAYTGDDDHMPGTVSWNLKYTELLSAYYSAYDKRHNQEDLAHQVPPTLAWGRKVYCRHSEGFWPSGSRGLVHIRATPAWRMSDGWSVRVSLPSGDIAEGFAGGALIVPVPAMEPGTVRKTFKIEVFENCSTMNDGADPIQTMDLEMEFDVRDLLAGSRIERADEVDQAVIRAMSLHPEAIDQSFRDAASEDVVLDPWLLIDWQFLARQTARDLAFGIELTLVDEQGRERARVVAAGMEGGGRVVTSSSHMTMLCGEDVTRWHAVIRSVPSLVSIVDSDVWSDLEAGRVVLWQSDGIEVPLTRLIAE